MNYVHEILEIFLPTRPVRKAWMSNPNEVNNYVYATDGHCMCRISREKCDRSYPPHPGTGPCDVIFAEAVKNMHQYIDITREQLETALSKIQLVPALITCPKCDGFGEINGDKLFLDTGIECPDCEEGFVEDNSAPKVMPADHVAVRMGDVYFAPKYLNKLLQVMKKIPDCRCVHIAGADTPIKGQLFAMGKRDSDAPDFDIVLMPLWPTNDPEWRENYNFYDFETGDQIFLTANTSIDAK